MTNYNERLDEILFNLCDLSYASFITQEEPNRVAEQLLYDRAKAKQALTSLIKELVAEAKPDKLKESDYTLNMRVPHNPPSNTTRTNLYRKGYNDSLDQFEYNLLKALEEL